MLDLLIELGFDINDRSGTKTALHHAAEGDDINRARLRAASFVGAGESLRTYVNV